MNIKDYSENKPAEIKKGRFIYFEKKKRKIKGLKNIIRDNAIIFLLYQKYKLECILPILIQIMLQI